MKEVVHMPRCKHETALGCAVRIRLIERNMTQKELAEKVGCSQRYIWLIINGYRTGDKYMDAIREELNIDGETA